VVMFALGGRPAFLVDSIVLNQIKAATGGRLRLAFSGGSAMSRETHEFLNLVLVMTLQGEELLTW